MFVISLKAAVACLLEYVGFCDIPYVHRFNTYLYSNNVSNNNLFMCFPWTRDLCRFIRLLSSL